MDRQEIHGGDIKDIVMAASGTMEDLPAQEPDVIETPKTRLEEMMKKSENLKLLIETLNLELADD